MLLLASAALGLWHADWRLDSGRRWDERFSLRNAHFLLAGWGRPQNAYYPSLSFLPATGVFWVVNGIARAAGSEPPVRIHGDHASPAAYLVARLLSVCFMLMALLLTYRVGVLCCDQWTGLLATALLAFSPEVIDKGSIFKPDILLLATTLAAVWFALKALEVPSKKWFLIAGAAIGVAMSAKYNGGPVAFSLVVVAALALRVERRAWRWLLAAAVAAAAAFVLLNPWLVTHPEIYRDALDFQLAHYQRMGEIRSGGSHLAQLAFLPSWITSPMALGLFPGVFSLVGLLGWAALLWRDRSRGKSRKIAVLGGFLVGYTVLYVASSTNPVGRNWLPLLPYFALAGAWLARELWRRAARRCPLTGRSYLVVPVLLVAAFLWFLHGAGYVYRLHVPTTAEVATSWILDHLPRPEGRILVTEIPPSWQAIQDRGADLGVLEPESLIDLPSSVLTHADALLLPARDLRRAGARSYRGVLSKMPDREEKRIVPAFFKLRGPPLVAVVAPWRRVDVVAGEMLPGASAHSWRWIIPPGFGGAPVSFVIDLRSRNRVESLGSIRVLLGPRVISRAIGRHHESELSIVTERASTAPGELLELVAPTVGKKGTRIKLRAYRWRSPRASSCLDRVQLPSRRRR